MTGTASAAPQGAIAPVAWTRRVSRRVRWYLPAFLTGVIVLLVWEVGMGVFNLRTSILPPPSAIFGELIGPSARVLTSSGYNTLVEALGGFALGVAVGVLIGVATAHWVGVRNVLLPVAIAANAVPIIAFAPIINNWFGSLNPLSRMVMAAIAVVFPVMINVIRGLTQVDASALELMRSYAATDWQIFRRVRVPNALPYFFTALKIGATLSLIGAIVGDYFSGSSEVLGYFIVTSASRLRFDQTWAAIFITALAGIVFYLVIVARSASRSRGTRRSARCDPDPLLDRGWTRRRRSRNLADVLPVRRVEEGMADGAVRHRLRRDIRMGSIRRYTLLAAAASLVAAACQGAAAPTAAPSAAATAVRLQLQWAPQAQFAGYFAADKEGYYRAEGLTVTLVPGGPDVIPQVVGSAPNGPEFTISWVPKVLEAREAPQSPSDLVDIAQIFQRSGTLSVAFKESGITKPADFKGKKVGAWGFGNEFEVTAAATKAGLKEGTDYTKVVQQFDMVAFLKKEIDVAEAMIYNEYAQVLESEKSAGTLYQPTDLNVIDYNKEGTAMLQDAIFARDAWLKQGTNADTATKFLRASFKGWIFCRDNAAKCVEYTTAAGSTLGKGHQAWMMNEINPLIWPSPGAIGQVDDKLWQQTVDVALAAGIIKKAPSVESFRKDLARNALAGITGDTTGASFTKGTVQVTPKGE